MREYIDNKKKTTISDEGYTRSSKQIPVQPHNYWTPKINIEEDYFKKASHLHQAFKFWILFRHAFAFSDHIVTLTKHIELENSESKSELQKKFNKYAEQWKKETGGYSTMIHITGNDNYLDIIGLGPDVIPYILKDLVKEPDYWFVALKHLTKADPVKKEHFGDIEKMTEDWINWGRDNKFI